MVSLSSSVRTRSGLRSADMDASTFVVPRTRTKKGERAFSVFDVAFRYEAATVSVTVTSQVAQRPSFHGVTVRSSGRLPSALRRPCGSFIDGNPALESERHIIYTGMALMDHLSFTQGWRWLHKCICMVGKALNPEANSYSYRFVVQPESACWYRNGVEPVATACCCCGKKSSSVILSCLILELSLERMVDDNGVQYSLIAGRDWIVTWCAGSRHPMLQRCSDVSFNCRGIP